MGRFGDVARGEPLTTRLAPYVTPTALVLGASLGIFVAWRADASPVVILAIAALPLALLFSYRAALGALTVILVARALLDDVGNQLVTGGLAAAVVALAIVVLGRSPTWVPAFFALAAYVIVSAWAGAGAHGASFTYAEALRSISCAAVVVVAAKAPGRPTVRSVAHVTQAIALVPALLAIFQAATGTASVNNGAMRASGTLAHENSAAMLFALANLATFVLLLDSRRRRWLHAGLLGVFLTAQIATGSIGGLVAAVVMALTYLTSSAVRRADRVLLSTLGLALAVYAATTSRVGAQRLAEYSQSSGEETSLAWRVQAWEHVLAFWRSNPVWGNGIGSTTSPTVLGGHIPHNEYVRLLAELGVVGLAGILVVTALTARSLVRSGRVSSTPAASAFALATLAGLAVNALAANTMMYTVAFCTALYIVGACWRISHQTEGDQTGEDLARIERRWATAPGQTPTNR